MTPITELIPQRSPIIMVDLFLRLSEDGISQTRLEIKEDNLFVEDGKLSECGIIEHMAQSAAARIGYISKQQNKEIPIGFIGAIKNFQLLKCPEINQIINTKIEIIYEISNISLIKAVCKINDKDIASCNMKIFLDI